MDRQSFQSESPLLKRLRALEDPRPHLNEAKDSLGRLIAIQKDLLLLDIEIRTLNQLKRLAYGIAAILSFELMLGLSLGWISWALFQRGWSPWILALGAFVIFGTLTLGFVSLARNVGVKDPEEEE